MKKDGSSQALFFHSIANSKAETIATCLNDFTEHFAINPEKSLFVADSAACNNFSSIPCYLHLVDLVVKTRISSKRLMGYMVYSLAQLLNPVSGEALTHVYSLLLPYQRLSEYFKRAKHNQELKEKKKPLKPSISFYLKRVVPIKQFRTYALK